MYVIMKKDQPICMVDVQICSLAGPVVNNYKILNEENLPFQYDRTYNNDTIIANIRQWLRSRAIPNSERNLDQIMFDVYGLNPAYYGRMYEYQFIGAFLSYMTSSKDDYWLNPVGNEYLSYVLVDQHFIDLYICKPTTYEIAKNAGGKFRRCLRNR